MLYVEPPRSAPVAKVSTTSSYAVFSTEMGFTVSPVAVFVAVKSSADKVPSLSRVSVKLIVAVSFAYFAVASKELLVTFAILRLSK